VSRGGLHGALHHKPCLRPISGANRSSAPKKVPGPYPFDVSNNNGGLRDSAGFWIAVAAVLLAAGGIIVGVTAGKTGATHVKPVVLAVFAAGCLLLLGGLGATVYAVALVVADRIVARRTGLVGAAPTISAAPPVLPPAAKAPPSAPPSPKPPRQMLQIPGGHHPPALDFKRLTGYFADHTEVQAKGLVQPWIGQRVTFVGVVRDIKEDCSVFADGHEDPADSVFLHFPPKVRTRLAQLHRGDPIMVVGSIRRVESRLVILEDCELVE